MSTISLDKLKDSSTVLTSQHEASPLGGAVHGMPEEFALDEKTLVRKIDYRLVPWLSLLYLLSFLDR